MLPGSALMDSIQYNMLGPDGRNLGSTACFLCPSRFRDQSVWIVGPGECRVEVSGLISCERSFAARRSCFANIRGATLASILNAFDGGKVNGDACCRLQTRGTG